MFKPLGLHFFHFMLIFCKKLVWGTPSKSSWRHMRPKIDQVAPKWSPNSFPRDPNGVLNRLLLQMPPEAPKGPILNDFVCILVPHCLIFKHVANKSAESLQNNFQKTCNNERSARNSILRNDVIATHRKLQESAKDRQKNSNNRTDQRR